MNMLLLGLVEFISMIGILITFVVFIIQMFRKKQNKKIFGFTSLGFLSVLIICIIITPAPIDEPKEEIETVEKQIEESEVASDKEEKITEAPKESSETPKPTTEEKESITKKDKKPTKKSEKEKSKEKTEVNDSSTEDIDLSVGFDEIYLAYKENELRADEKYQYNRYQITAKVNGMETGGLFNLTGGATLTMEKQIGNTVVFFYAEFEKEQEENLKQINVGDTITFEGKCLSAGSWTECSIVKE